MSCIFTLEKLIRTARHRRDILSEKAKKVMLKHQKQGEWGFTFVLDNEEEEKFRRRKVYLIQLLTYIYIQINR
jgi:hypothetical protein